MPNEPMNQLIAPAQFGAHLLARRGQIGFGETRRHEEWVRQTGYVRGRALSQNPTARILVLHDDAQTSIDDTLKEWIIQNRKLAQPGLNLGDDMPITKAISML